MEQLLIETKEIQEGKEPLEHRKTLKWYKMLLMRTTGQPFDEMKVDCLPLPFIEYCTKISDWRLTKCKRSINCFQMIIIEEWPSAANWLLQRHERFCDKLIMTEEAAFSMDGSVNTQNTRFWSENRPEGFVFEKRPYDTPIATDSCPQRKLFSSNAKSSEDGYWWMWSLGYCSRAYCSEIKKK